MGVCRHPHLGLRQQGTESLVEESVQEPGAGRRGEGAPGREQPQWVAGFGKAAGA